MDFFEKVGATISTKGHEAVDKVKEMTEIASLKSQISACEEIIKKNYQEIGKLYYEQYAEQEDAPYEKQCNAVKNAERGIRELERKIQELKGL